MTNEEALEIIKKAPLYDNTTWTYAKELHEAINTLEQELCEDAISREDALMALTGEWAEPTDELIHRFIKRIKKLPSVNPQEPKWIPVSERLPEDCRPVLIYAWNVHHVVARYDSFRTENGYKKCWVTADAWNGNTEIKHDVVAWMPLPEPFEMN